MSPVPHADTLRNTHRRTHTCSRSCTCFAPLRVPDVLAFLSSDDATPLVCGHLASRWSICHSRQRVLNFDRFYRLLDRTPFTALPRASFASSRLPPKTPPRSASVDAMSRDDCLVTRVRAFPFSGGDTARVYGRHVPRWSMGSQRPCAFGSERR